MEHLGSFLVQLCGSPLVTQGWTPGIYPGQSASITRMSSERFSPITSYHAYSSSHEISYLKHHQRIKRLQDRGDSGPVLETPVFLSMTSNNEQGDVPERSA